VFFEPAEGIRRAPFVELRPQSRIACSTSAAATAIGPTIRAHMPGAPLASNPILTRSIRLDAFITVGSPFNKGLLKNFRSTIARLIASSA